MQKARIKLTSPDYREVDEISQKIIEVAKRTGVKYSGPIPLPTKKLVVEQKLTRNGKCAYTSELLTLNQMNAHCEE